MTNIERIKNMTIEQMAADRVKYYHTGGWSGYWGSSDGHGYDTRSEAINAEIRWLNKESEEEQ